MQVLILAAGQSSRFYPFNRDHKSCFTLLGKPIIQHTVESVKKTGITDIVIVVSKQSIIPELLGDGKSLGVTLTYVIQENPTGAGDAIILAKEQLQSEFFLLNANKIEFDHFAKSMLLQKKGQEDGVLLVQPTDYVGNFGIAVVENGRVTDVIEKPEESDILSHLKIIGMYLLPKIFLQTLETISPEHYSLEKAFAKFAKEKRLCAVETKDEIVSLKYPWDLLQVKNHLLSHQIASRAKDVEIGKNVVIDESVVIESGVKIMDGVVIKGPCYIGKNAYIGTNAILRGGVCLEEGTVVGAQMEVKNSIVSKNTTTHSGFIGDSVIGKNCKIAAFFCSGNVRLDRQPVKVTIGKKKIDSHQKALGVCMGDETKTGIRVSTMPGVLIGKHVLVGPQTTVLHNIEENKKYYTKFSEVVEENND